VYQHFTRLLRRAAVGHSLGAFTCAAMLWPLGSALADPAGLCDTAAAEAAAATGVPVLVLQAIALTESGLRRGDRMRPWPWTTNVEGQGRWFDSRAAAAAHVRDQIALGHNGIDIGCFQINHRWHGEAFASPEAMLDPGANALYAARFLAGLHAEFGSWEAAAGAYHSRTPAHAERYTERFRAHLAALQSAPEPAGARTDVAAASTRALRPSGYPLLQAGAPAAPGSVVPLGAARGSLIATGARALQ